MAFRKFANASIVRSDLDFKGWDAVRHVNGGSPFEDRTAQKVILQEYLPKDYLLTHVTIMASVDVEEAKQPLGKQMVGGFQIDRRFGDYLITPKTARFVNHNGDSWTRAMLLASYRTFIGAQNYCFVPGTCVYMKDGTTKPIEDVHIGEEVLTHKGRGRKVVHTFTHDISETIVSLYFDRSKTPVKCTKGHPFRALSVDLPPTRTYSGSKATSQMRYAKDRVRSLVRDGHAPGVCHFDIQKVWASAETLQPGALVLGPETRPSILGTISDALLLGYYAAEGYQLKHGPRINGVAFSFGHHEDIIVDHVEELVIAKWPNAIRSRSNNSSTSLLRVNSKEAGAWFSEMCPGYSESKKLHPSVLDWSSDALTALFAAWVTGDAQFHKRTRRVVGATTSRYLADQMQLIADRVGIRSSHWIEKEASFEKRRLLISQVVQTVDGVPKTVTIEAKHSMHNLTVSPGSFHLFKDLTPRWVMQELSASRKRDDSSFYVGTRLHNVQWVGEEPYTGVVHNLEVEGDNSFVLANGVAVHNCEHIQIPEMSKGRIIDAVARDIGDSVYIDLLVATARRHKPLVAAIVGGELSTLSMGCQVTYTQCSKCGNVAEDETQLCNCIRYAKQNTFYDDTGVQRIIAELCGHASEPETVKFIEASWVANPAFTGAVLRSILTAEEQEMAGVGSRMAFAFAEPARIPDPSLMSRAAFSRVSQEEDAAPGQAEPEKKDDDPLAKAVADLVEQLREKALEKVRGEINQDDLGRPDENRNDSLIKSALHNPTWARIGLIVSSAVGKNREAAKKLLLGLILYRSGGWKSVVSSRSFSGREILALSRVLDTAQNHTRTAGESRIYGTIITIGGLSSKLTEEKYLQKCRAVMGRDLTASEQLALITKGRLFALGL